MTDPIGDMLTRIRNAQAVFKEDVVFPFSGIKHQIAKILEKEKLVGKVRKTGKGVKKEIGIILLYKDKAPLIQGLKRISKPGQRIYKSAKEIRPVRNGFGIGIVSTSKGLMTNKEARKSKLGGEIICEIW